ncbi:MAG: cell division protein FtsX [Bacteroidia bacterium]|nr:cell division protein FtsX [Bacteroidia bacterium]
MSESSVRIKLQTSSVTVVVSLSLVLLMLGLAGWTMLNFKNLTNTIKEEFGFQILLHENVSQANIDQFRKKLDAAVFVKEANYVSKDVAADEMKKELGENFVEFLGENPLPPAINIKLNSQYANNDSLDGIKKEIRSMGEGRMVKDIAYQEAFFDEIDTNSKDVGLVLLILSLLLVIVAVGLINNTIRLSIYSKRFLLRTMFLVGATSAFIRKPFILRGIKQGVVAGIFACVLMGGFIFILLKFFPILIENQEPNQLVFLMVGVILLGVLISSVSSALAVRRYLRLKQEDLYF